MVKAVEAKNGALHEPGVRRVYREPIDRQYLSGIEEVFRGGNASLRDALKELCLHPESFQNVRQHLLTLAAIRNHTITIERAIQERKKRGVLIGINMALDLNVQLEASMRHGIIVKTYLNHLDPDGSVRVWPYELTKRNGVPLLPHNPLYDRLGINPQLKTLFHIEKTEQGKHYLIFNFS